MYDYRPQLKSILNKIEGDDKSLKNGLSAILTILKLADTETVQKSFSNKNSSTQKFAVKNYSASNEKEIDDLIINLTRLIELPGDSQAKNSITKDINKLTFNPTIGKTYGKKLANLNHAVKNSTETISSKNRKIFEDALKPKKVKRDYRKGRRYTVIRALTGADLIDDSGQVRYSVSENQAHPLNLKSGDIVEAIENDLYPENAEILRVVGFKKLRSRDFDKINEFKYGVVQGSPGNYSVSQNIRGEKLKINHKSVIVAINTNVSQNKGENISDGSIVDLAWYEGDVRIKKNPASAVKIRWVYETEQPTRINKKKKKETTSSSDNQLELLDMNLHYQRVGIAIGDNQNEKLLEQIVDRYNGVPVAIDAFNGKRKVIENQIKDLDIVILVTAYAAHDSSWNISEFASKYNVKFAVSSSKGYRSFERAIYRAQHGLPAYEGTQQILYRTVANKK